MYTYTCRDEAKKKKKRHWQKQQRGTSAYLAPSSLFRLRPLISNFHFNKHVTLCVVDKSGRCSLKAETRVCPFHDLFTRDGERLQACKAWLGSGDRLWRRTARRTCTHARTHARRRQAHQIAVLDASPSVCRSTGVACKCVIRGIGGGDVTGVEQQRRPG